MIYDHYLTVRPWRPNFRPEKEEIERVTVWVRLPELPIEYYDADFLDFLGNRIGRTVKVDKTTALLSRGKFARLCVEVDLNMPLLAMFEIKGHVYKIEYEGLHLLCMACGKFGHHKDQCVDREKFATSAGEVPVEHANENRAVPANKAKEDGPWTVVQKQRWPRKAKEKGDAATGRGRILPASINGNSTKSGTRFDILGTNEEIMEENNEEREVNLASHSVPIIANNEFVPKKKVVNTSIPSTTQSGRVNHARFKETTNNSTRAPHEQTKTATKVQMDKTNTTVNEKVVPPRQVRGATIEPHVTALHGDHTGTINHHSLQATTEPHKEMLVDKSNITNGPGPVGHHSTRPPDTRGNNTSHTPFISSSSEDVGMIDSEEFVDANEPGESAASDSDMEVVNETAPLLN